MKNYTSDMREVYGVTQSQIATFDTSMKKTLRTRPTSGKTTAIRPSSSKNYWNLFKRQSISISLIL